MDKKIYDEAFKMILPILNKSLDIEEKGENAEDKNALNQEIKEYIKNPKDARILIDRLTEGYINQLGTINAEVTVKNIKELIKPEGLLASARIIYGAAKMEIILAKLKELQTKKD